MVASIEFNDWVESARRVPVQAELERRGLWLLKMSGGAPCPVCGGRDRFSVNVKKDLWFCRASQRGGDAIALAEYLDGTDFLAAVETVAGVPMPSRRSAETVEKRREYEESQQRRLEALRREQERKSQELATEREKERRRCYRIWLGALPIAGTPVETYLAARGLYVTAGARLRFLADYPLWSDSVVLHSGPAMIGGMIGPDGRFAGIHATWLDATQPKGKVLVIDPATGKYAPSKKTRGSWLGATVPLIRSVAPVRFFLGEGIETVTSVHNALAAVASPLLEGAEFHSACNLGNKAADRVNHPTLQIERRDGAGDCVDHDDHRRSDLSRGAAMLSAAVPS